MLLMQTTQKVTQNTHKRIHISGSVSFLRLSQTRGQCLWCVDSFDLQWKQKIFLTIFALNPCILNYLYIFLCVSGIFQSACLLQFSQNYAFSDKPQCQSIQFTGSIPGFTHIDMVRLYYMELSNTRIWKYNEHTETTSDMNVTGDLHINKPKCYI